MGYMKNKKTTIANTIFFAVAYGLASVASINSGAQQAPTAPTQTWILAEFTTNSPVTTCMLVGARESHLPQCAPHILPFYYCAASWTGRPVNGIPATPCGDGGGLGYMGVGNSCASGILQSPGVCAPPLIDPPKNPGPPPCIAQAGNPISCGNGNKYETRVEYEGAGDFPLAFGWTYNSISGGGLEAYDFEVLGVNRVHSFAQRIVVHSSPQLSTARILRPDGKTLSYNLAGSN